MKGTRRAFLCLVLALVAGALAAPVASASEYGPKEFPEVGRCVKTALGVGTYKGANCQFVAAPGRGKFEWIPATQSEKLTFEGGGGETQLRTLGHETINCIDTNIKGEWLNEKQASVVIEMQGCTNQFHEQCTNTGGINKSEISSGSLTAEVGFIQNVEKKVVVGIDFKPPFGQKALFTYGCEGTIKEGKGLEEQNAVEGSVIAKWKPIQSMKTTFKAIFHVLASGKQDPEKFESGLKDTLITSYKKGLESLGEAPSTLGLKEISGTSSSYEIRVKEVPFA
jgi:hypothetical protein